MQVFIGFLLFIGLVAIIVVIRMIVRRGVNAATRQINRHLIQPGAYAAGVAVVHDVVQFQTFEPVQTVRMAILDGLGFASVPQAMLSSQIYIAGDQGGVIDFVSGSRFSRTFESRLSLYNTPAGGTRGLYQVVSWKEYSGMVGQVEQMQALPRRIEDIVRSLDPAISLSHSREPLARPAQNPYAPVQSQTSYAGQPPQYQYPPQQTPAGTMDPKTKATILIVVGAVLGIIAIFVWYSSPYYDATVPWSILFAIAGIVCVALGARTLDRAKYGAAPPAYPYQQQVQPRRDGLLGSLQRDEAAPETVSQQPLLAGSQEASARVAPTPSDEAATVTEPGTPSSAEAPVSTAWQDTALEESTLSARASQSMVSANRVIQFETKVERAALKAALLEGLALEPQPYERASGRVYLRSADGATLDFIAGTRWSEVFSARLSLLNWGSGGSQGTYSVKDWRPSEGVDMRAERVIALSDQIIDIVRSLDPKATVKSYED